ncbi:MAG: response regulator transcription factor [Oscillospiraceae bacterium]|nr:response regulator transcription factor [Oscillospiraceae bacterium]
MFNILVVEDDPNIRRLIVEALREGRYNPFPARDASEALEVMDRQHIDLMVTDLMMPGMDGYALTGQLREAGYGIPVLMVTARDTIKDKRKGFIVGTDDYMVKPIDEEELLLRVKALLRRARIVSERKVSIGRVTLEYDSLTVSRGSERLTLPQKEFLLLYKLLSYPGTVFTRMQLMDEIWGLDSDSSDHTVSVHVGRLRERFAGWGEFSVETVRGLGYKAVRNDGR